MVTLDNITPLSIGPCSSEPPKCLSVAPGNVSSTWTNFTLAAPWCKGEIVVNNWWYNYQTCRPGNVKNFFLKDFSTLGCECAESLFQCRIYHDDSTCQKMYLATVITQLSLGVVALILNLLVVIKFLKTRSLRKKIHCNLIFHQAFADLAGCVICGIPFAFGTLYILWQGYFTAYGQLTIALSTLTIFLSLFIFTIISIERCISLWKPLWHRVYVLKRHIWFSIMISWLVSSLLTATVPNDLNSKYTIALAVVAILMILITSCAFLLTFLKAFKSLQENTSIKKQLRLTGMFSAMFLVFIISFTPFIYVRAFSTGYLWELILSTTFLLTSLFNPALTLCMRKEFRVTCKRSLSISEDIRLQQIRSLSGNNSASTDDSR